MTDLVPGAHVDLVPVTPAIAAALLAGGDPGVLLAPGYPHADTFDAIGGFLATGATAPVMFLVRRHDDGLVVGDCGTRGGPDSDGAVEIGYGLAPAARGAGLATDAVRALLGWLRTQPGVTAVRAEVELGNAPSRRLLERLGFAVESVGDREVQYSRAL